MRNGGGGAFVVGRTPWSAAGPLAGSSMASERSIRREKSVRSGRADQGVRPTNAAH
jgi:hypothetical protein